MVTIALLDSGIDQLHPGLGALEVVAAKSSFDRVGHGTACAGIIAGLVPAATILDVPVLDSQLSCRPEVLANLLEWSVAQNANVINLSLGITGPVPPDLRDCCDRAVGEGIILVAAEHNLGLESFPASFPEVIGVTGAPIHVPGGYYYRPGEKIECVARGDQQRLCWLDGRHVFLSGNSFAAPHITGIIARWMEDEPGMTLADVRQKLKENALPEPTARNRASFSAQEAVKDDLSWIKRAVLYPMNKEMHAMIRYRDQLTFDIVGVADHVGKGMVGKDVGEAIGVEKVGMKVLPRVQNLMDKGADTLVIGYVDQLGRVGERDLVAEYVDLALENGLNVFSFLAVRRETYPDLHVKAEERGLRIEYPDVTVEAANQALQYPNRYRQVDVPVLGVFGTSSQQGKFTLQLGLRKRLKELGYTVGQLGTEHHSELFGMDGTFPVGYASPIRLPIRFHVPYLDYKMREINDSADPDIILVGSQSGTIPFDIIEHSTHSVTSVPFLWGTKPDACVLVVNSIDPEEYIQDTIDALRSVAKCKTIAIAMSDKEKHIRSAYGQSMVTPRPLEPREVDRHLDRLRNRFDLPAACIAREHEVSELTDRVLEYFSDDEPADRVREEATVEYATG